MRISQFLGKVKKGKNDKSGLKKTEAVGFSENVRKCGFGEKNEGIKMWRFLAFLNGKAEPKKSKPSRFLKKAENVDLLKTTKV